MFYPLIHIKYTIYIFLYIYYIFVKIGNICYLGIINPSGVVQHVGIRGKEKKRKAFVPGHPIQQSPAYIARSAISSNKRVVYGIWNIGGYTTSSAAHQYKTLPYYRYYSFYSSLAARSHVIYIHIRVREEQRVYSILILIKPLIGS
jgi:hypothetical protein